MLAFLEKILSLLGVPGKIIAVVLVSGGIVTATIVIDHAVIKREDALQASVSYIPRSQAKDSLILAKVIELSNANKARFDSMEKHVKVLNVNIRAIKTVNEQKFELLINNNSYLKQSFESLDNSLNWIMQSISINEKKKLTPYNYLTDITTL